MSGDPGKRDPRIEQSISKHDAQRRADQIRAFRAEIAELARDGVDPPAAWLDAASTYHDGVLRALAATFDIDRTTSEKRMSLGMRVATALGAAALTAAVVSFFYRIWGTLPTAAQVSSLTAAPLVSVIAMEIAARRERTLYVASLCAIVACAAFVLQTVMLGDMFNMRESPHAVAAWGAFALAVAASHRLAVPWAAGVAALICYPAALEMTIAGAPFDMFWRHLEVLLAPAAVAIGLASRAPRELRQWSRAPALVLLLFPILLMSIAGTSSLLPFSRQTVEIVYQVLAVVVGVAVVAWGVRRGYGDALAIGAAFCGLFLLLRFVDWWWDWMPKYLFFLILAGVALGWLWILRRLRRRMAEAVA